MFEDALQWFGYGLCHQLPERSFFGGGLQVPVCARDTGIYVGFVISIAVLALLHRGERPRGFAGRAAWIAIAIGITLMGIDGVTSYAGIRETTNDLRLLTGLMAGFATAAIVLPMLNDELWVSPGLGRVLSPAWRLTAWVAMIPVTFAAVRYGAPILGAVYPVVVAACVVATLASVNLVIVAMFPAFDRKSRVALDLLAPAAIATGLALLEIWLSGFVRALLESLARSL